MKVTIQTNEERSTLPPITWHGGTSFYLTNGVPYAIASEKDVEEVKAGKTRIGKSVLALGRFPCFAIPSDSDRINEVHTSFLDSFPVIIASHPRDKEQAIVTHRYAPDVSLGFMISGYASTTTYLAQRKKDIALQNANLGIATGLAKRQRQDGSSVDIGLTSVVVMVYGIRAPVSPIDYGDLWESYERDLIDPATPSHALFRLTMRSYNSQTLYDACKAVSLAAVGLNLLRKHPKDSKKFIDKVVKAADAVDAYNGRADELRLVLEGNEDIGPPSIAVTFAGQHSIVPKNVSTIISSPMFAIGDIIVTGPADSLDVWKTMSGYIARLSRRPADPVDDDFLTPFAEAMAQALYPAIMMPAFVIESDPLQAIIDTQVDYVERLFAGSATDGESHDESGADEADHSSDQF